MVRLREDLVRSEGRGALAPLFCNGVHLYKAHGGGGLVGDFGGLLGRVGCPLGKQG